MPGYRMETVTFLSLISVTLGKASTGLGFTVGDLIYGLAIVFSARTRFQKSADNAFSSYAILSITLVIWAIVDLILVLSVRPMMPLAEFGGSFSKLFLYSFGGIFVLNRLMHQN